MGLYLHSNILNVLTISIDFNNTITIFYRKLMMNKNNKAGILTLYHNNYNYGGLLQSYALWKTLDDLGVDAKQISYLLDSGYENYKGKFVWNIKTLIKSIAYGQYYRNILKRQKIVQKFELSIPHTKEVDANSIKDVNNEFDAFICGSDQIWNPIGWQDNLFLSFVSNDKKKISYAASMARDSLTKEEAEYVINHIKTFYAISVREETSAKALKEYDSSLQIEVMPDPTLLLSKEEWSSLTVEGKINVPYIFAYFLGDNYEQRDKAIEYAKSVNKKIYFIDYLNYEQRDWCIAHKEYMLDNVSVPDFLTLIKNADLVITDSFHGAVFSSIFETPFVALNRFKNNDKNSMNSRIVTLMNTLDIDRNFNVLNNDKDYSYTNEELKSIREALKYQSNKGKEFLRRSLEISNDK